MPMQISISNAIGGASARESFINNYSVELDGIDAYVDCGTNSSLNFTRTDTFSYSFWVKRNSFGTNHMMLSNMNPSGNRRGMFFNLNSENKVVVMLRTDTSFTSQRLFWKTNELINDSNWHHIVFTFDGSSTVGGGKIYIDGAAATFDVADGALSASIIPSSTTPFLIGAMSTAPLLPADAFMDEVAVFGSELSASDVSSIYNGNGAGKPGDLSSFNPLSWWRFEEGSGTTAADSGSASNTGTLENSATFSTDVP
jgi:hypothetical protein